jgi:hypothetical protein
MTYKLYSYKTINKMGVFLFLIIIASLNHCYAGLDDWITNVDCLLDGSELEEKDAETVSKALKGE